MKTYYVIQRKGHCLPSLSGLAYEKEDRKIIFRHDCVFAVVLDSSHPGNKYTVHKTESGVMRACENLRGKSYAIIDTSGNRYNYVEDVGLFRM